jgi:hypothetical protein
MWQRSRNPVKHKKQQLPFLLEPEITRASARTPLYSKPKPLDTLAKIAREHRREQTGRIP